MRELRIILTSDDGTRTVQQVVNKAYPDPLDLQTAYLELRCQLDTLERCDVVQNSLQPAPERP